MKLKTQPRSPFKWRSPFQVGSDYKNRLEGKQLISRKVTAIMTNSNSHQLKSLTTNRKVSLGPTASVNQITSRENVIKTMRKRDPIHLVID